MRHLSIVFLMMACVVTGPVNAENMIMTRIHMDFIDGQEKLAGLLGEYGYEVAHVQKCDGGLKGFGYSTDLYRTIFYGKLEEVRSLSDEYPELIPYLPLKMALIQERNSIVLVALNPQSLADYFPQAPLQVQFTRWESDIRSIFDEMN